MKLLHRVWNVYKRQLFKRAQAYKDFQYFYTRNIVVMSITSKCNFSCKHCMRDFNDTRELPLEIAQKAIEGAKKYNFRAVAITGGEPLLYSKLEELIEMIVQNGYCFSLVTNGWLFNDHFELFTRYRKHIAFIAFSLESTKEEANDAIRQKGSYARLTESFRLCRQRKIPFRIITTASPLNFDEIVDIGVFSKQQKAQCLVFTTMLPCPRTQENKLVLDAARRQELFIMLRGLGKIVKLPIVIGADIRGQSNLRICAPMNLNEVTIDVDGNLVRCCELAGYDSNNICTGSVVTSLKDKTFDEAFKLFSEHIHRVVCERIDEYQKSSDPTHINFSSCFYCVYKLGS